ncbi:MAG: hypothetical protein Q9198_003508, partial [Flavoplaca austrocitrina]
MSVGLSEEAVLRYMKLLPVGSSDIVVACINSGDNVTVSGSEDAIDSLKGSLDSSGIFARKLLVDVAYHSPHMSQIAAEYLSSIQGLEPGQMPIGEPFMVSSVTGMRVSSAELSQSEYWVRNMVSQVRFLDALVQLTVQPSALMKKLGAVSQEVSGVYQLVEVGPHSALKGPIRTILASHAHGKGIRYDSLLVRKSSALKTTLEVIGRLHCLGYNISFKSVNRLDDPSKKYRSLPDLPEYPFDHSQRYWYESRISESLRLRKHPRLDLLGTPVSDWNPLEARWRKFVRIPESPWIEDHKVNGATIYPAAAMLVMAIEGARQMCPSSRNIKGYLLTDTIFSHAVGVPADGTDVELQFFMRPVQESSEQNSMHFQYRVCVYENGQWIDNCRGAIKIFYSDSKTEGSIAQSDEEKFRQAYYKNLWEEKQRTCTEAITSQKMYQHFLKIGMGYGPTFQALENIHFNKSGEAIAEVMSYDWLSHEGPQNVQDQIIHPVTLDAAAQLIFLALTAGATKTIATTVPTRITNLWVSGSGMDHPSTTSIKAYTKSAFKGPRNTESSLFGLDSKTGNLKLVISSLETTAVAGLDAGVAAPAKDIQLCSSLVSKPDIETMSKQCMLAHCKSQMDTGVEPVDFYKELSFLIFVFMSRALDHLSTHQPANMSAHYTKYVTWMRRQFDHYRQGTLGKDDPHWEILMKKPTYVESVINRIQTAGAEGKLFVTVGMNLSAVLQGEMDPLDLLFGGDLAKDYYRDIFNSPCCQSMTALVDLLSHKNPGMNIIEVGAGTGGMTQCLLSALTVPITDDESLARFARYSFTDISGAYFEKVEARLGLSKKKGEYRVLDIDFDPCEQGFEEGSYDVVAAGLYSASVFNADTSSNGKLLIYEILVPDLPRTGFVFGLLPGWWLGIFGSHNHCCWLTLLGAENGRQWSPCISEGEWHDTLLRTGFSGIDLTFHDYQDGSCHEMGLIVSTATTEPSPMQHLPSIHSVSIVVDTSSSSQLSLASEVKRRLSHDEGELCSVVSLDEAASSTDISSEHFMIWLLELEQPFLCDINERNYELLHQCLCHHRRILWVNGAGGAAPSLPGYGAFHGLARVLRSEDHQLKCLTLSVDIKADIPPDDLTNRHADHIIKILQQSASQSLEKMESEYVDIDGVLHIGRMTPYGQLSQSVQKFDTPQQSTQAFGRAPPLAMEVANPGMLDSLLFVEDEVQPRPLAPEEVEIQIESAGINFMDCLTVLGRVAKSTIGGECAGVISRVGSACEQEFQPGDRVCATILDCFRTFARSDSMLVTKIPDSLSVKHAASVPVTGVTALYALKELAKLQKGESVLIHSAAGGTGQLAIQIAKTIGAVIFATVGSSEKKQLLIDRYGIPEDHILSSRNTSFADGIRRLTDNKGVDVVLNSLSGELLAASWDCIASFGRFVEIGKKDIHSHATLPMFPFRKNATFSAFDLDQIHAERPMVFRKSLLDVIRMLSQGEIKVADPLHIYSISDVESALRYMQGGKHMGKIVVDFLPDAPVQTSIKKKPTYSFDADASYLIVGGLGGIGRSIARWLIFRGARNLILLSRSGASSEAARALLAELDSDNVRIETPACDVTDFDALASTISRCMVTGMPPIKGCIQAAMVLQDSLFSNMSYNAWRAATAPKIDASWNLHKLLPDLSFFILLSSISGAIGNPGQANYAAGNTYQDALAAYRTASGQPAVALDLGWVATIGAVAESTLLQEGAASRGYLLPISETNIIALLEHYCDPELPLQLRAAAHPVVGLAVPAVVGTELPAFFCTPTYRTLHQVGSGNSDDKATSKAEDFTALFRACDTLTAAAEVVSSRLTQRLATAVGMPTGDVDTNRPLHAYGVDSLLAVELRN